MRILTKHLPEKNLTFLVSGGVDSIAACHWLKFRYRAKISILHFNHNCQSVNSKMEEAVKSFGHAIGCSTKVVQRDATNDIHDCSENGLRCWRLDELAKIGGNFVTAHHLDDAVENYLTNTLEGHPEYVPISEKTEFENFSIFHPFLINTKDEMTEYVDNNKLSDFVVVDPSNDDTKFRRNWIRKTILPEIYSRVNLRTVVRKKFYTK